MIVSLSHNTVFSISWQMSVNIFPLNISFKSLSYCRIPLSRQRTMASWFSIINSNFKWRKVKSKYLSQRKGWTSDYSKSLKLIKTARGERRLHVLLLPQVQSLNSRPFITFSTKIINSSLKKTSVTVSSGMKKSRKQSGKRVGLFRRTHYPNQATRRLTAGLATLN